MRDATTGPWVVYTMPVKGLPDGVRGVCQQSEWDAMERGKPGINTLIQAGIPNEGDAERLARGSAGETKPRGAKRAITSWPDAATAVLARPAALAAG